MITFEEFYGQTLPGLKTAEKQLVEYIDAYQEENLDEDIKIIQYCKSRIKSPDSMIEKLKKRKLPVNCETALTEIYDAVGIRIICSFIDDIYNIAKWLKGLEEIEIIETKDYVAYPKSNGYRSYHMILKIIEGPGKGIYAEIQIRTIALDFWANLEHQIKYKKTIKDEELIRHELKRCADEIASVDWSMQTLRELIADEVLLPFTPKGCAL